MPSDVSLVNQAGKPMPQKRWDHLVESWNRLHSVQREERIATCRREGHRWERLPASMNSLLCSRCNQYRDI